MLTALKMAFKNSTSLNIISVPVFIGAILLLKSEVCGLSKLINEDTDSEKRF